MKKNERDVLILFVSLLIVGFLFWQFLPGHSTPPAPVMSLVAVSSAPAIAPLSVSTAPLPSQVARPAPTFPRTKPTLPPVSASGPTPPKLELHKELIPKDITIVRCYYGQEIAPPDSTFGFDINGSGFTKEFEKMIKVESGAAGIQIKNLKLMTANQIHGEMAVGPDVATAFVYPRVLIKGLPVFSAPDPFAVVRKDEVLTIGFISMDDSGRAGRFRVITNLDEDAAKRFRVELSTTGLEVSDFQFQLPYAVEGTLRIGQRVPPGEYDLTLFVGDKAVSQRKGMIHVVRPNIGLTGFLHGVTAAERFLRPGDLVQLYVQGTGLSPEDIRLLTARVDGYDMGAASFTFITSGQLRLAFQSPKEAPPKSYGVTISGTNGDKLYSRDGVFELVPENWIAGLQLQPPVAPGQKGILKIVGRDLSAGFVQALRIDVDEPGLGIGPLRSVSPSLIEAEIAVSSSVAPGDYWLHLNQNGKKISPPYGSIIKVGSY
ncbi:MAG: hypothetical protein WC859_04705 [Elusimicrobiota bacterium]|jgi:hypothetical protein